MNHPLIVLADGSRARFFTVRRFDLDGSEKLELVERQNLVSPEHQMRGEEIYTTTKSGIRFPKTVQGSHATTFDEHRDSHRRDVERRFAKAIAEHAAKLCKQTKANGVIVATDPRQLGLLRPELTHELPRELDVVEVPKDITHLEATAIQEILEDSGVLPESPPRPRIPRH